MCLAYSGTILAKTSRKRFLFCEEIDIPEQGGGPYRPCPGPEPRAAARAWDESGMARLCSVGMSLPHANLNFVNKGAFRQTKELSDAFVFLFGI